MSMISRRSFLKLAGVTAVATAGVSMLTGCKAMEDVAVTVRIHLEGSKDYTDLGTQTMPYALVKLVMIAPEAVLDLVKKQSPDYKDLEIKVDKDIQGNGKIVTDPKTGKMTMELIVKVVTVKVAYTVKVNGNPTATGTQTVPKGLKKIPEDAALTLVKEKLSGKYPTDSIELDKTVTNNLVIADNKVVIAVTVPVPVVPVM